MSRINEILELIVEESENVKHPDKVSRLYNVMMSISSLIEKEMERIRKEEREVKS